MLSQRPFKDRDEVFEAADRIWNDLGRDDWLEAFAAHPRIGADAHAGQDAQGRAWSEAEQAQVARAGADIRSRLAQANRDYEARFGFIYLVCASGRSADELLAYCHERLANDPGSELRVAAAEQARITRLRLEKLLEIGS